MLRCPDPSCGAAVGQDMIDILASNEDKGKYSRYFIRSYVEDNRKVSSNLEPHLVFQLLLVGIFFIFFIIFLLVEIYIGTLCYEFTQNERE